MTPAPRTSARSRILLVVLLLLVPVPQALGQSLLAYTCEEIRGSPAPSPVSGIEQVDECSGSEEEGDERVEASLDSDTVEGARGTAMDPPGAQGYPLISLAGTGEAGDPVEIQITEPSVHSILVRDVPAYEELAIQFVPADSPAVGRASPCMQHPLVAKAEEAIDEHGEPLPVDREDGVSAGEEVHGLDERDGVEGQLRLYPTDGFCAAVDATARATVDRPLFSVEREITPCTALACEHQTTDTATPEDSSDPNGTALFGPLMLYPGRWQVVRTDPIDVARKADDALDEAAPCENPLVVLCFEVRPCADTRDLHPRAPAGGRCLGPPSKVASAPLTQARSSGSSGGGCEAMRSEQGAGVDYTWSRCGRPCSQQSGGELRFSDRQVGWNEDAIFQAVETWDAWSERDLPHGNACDRHQWKETDVAQLGLSVAGPTALENRYSDTWNVTLHASARECDRDAFPRGNANLSRCHRAILKQPVIVVTDYRETRDTDRCQYPELHPPYDDEAKCVRVGLDADVVTPGDRDGPSHLYHTGGDGAKMPASMTENRSSSPKHACRLAALAVGVFGGPSAGGVVKIGCELARSADMFTSPPEERERYTEWQGTFNRGSGFRCDGGCWSLHNHLASNDGWERDQMAFGAMMEIRSCGQGRAPAYVAGTFLKGLAYEGPTGGIHQDGGDPSNRSAGHHYWGPGLTIRTGVDVWVGDDAPPCPTRGSS